MEFPTTLIEFQDRFPDEESCWHYLKAVRWPEGFLCPRCGKRKRTYLEGRRLFQRASYRGQTSVTARTVLHRKRTPLRKWFLAIFFSARHKQASRRCSFSAISVSRATRRPGRCCTSCVRPSAPSAGLGQRRGRRDILGGPRSGGKQGRGAPNKTMVLMMVERREQSAGTAERAGKILPWEHLVASIFR